MIFDDAHFNFSVISDDAYFNLFSMVISVVISVLLNRVMIIAEIEPKFKSLQDDMVLLKNDMVLVKNDMVLVKNKLNIP